MLVGERIIVKDLAEDLYDGQVLQKLFGEKGFEWCGGHIHSAAEWLSGS